VKKLLPVAAALVALAAFPAAANAAPLSGVVIAKDAKRHALVIASTSDVATVRLAKRAVARARLGARVAMPGAAKLPDGTFSARLVRALGRSSHVRFSAVLVKETPHGVVLSAGHSVFALRYRNAGRMSMFRGSGLEPGDRLMCDADIGRGGLQADTNDLHDVGHVDQLELEGIYLSTTGGVLDLAVVHRGLVHVKVPDGVSVPVFNPGDEISLVVAVEPDGTFALVRADNEDASDSEDDSGGDDGVDIVDA
jgi:hypothetical protein